MLSLFRPRNSIQKTHPGIPHHSEEHKQPPGQSNPESGIFYGWYIVASSWFMLFLLNAVSVSVFFKPMLEDLQWDRAMLSSVQSIGLIAITIILPIQGRLIDRFSPRLMCTIGMIFQVASSILNATATTIWNLYAARFLYGINAMPSTEVLVSRWFLTKRGTALGIVATGMPIGTMLLVPLSQYLILLWGWRATMWFWGGVILLFTVPLVLIIKNNPQEIGFAPDGKPAVIPGVREKGIKKVREGHASGDIGEGSGFHEAARTLPFYLLGIGQLLCGTGCGFMMTHILILATDMGYSDMVGAGLVSVQGAFNLVGVLLTGFLSDRFARKNIYSLTFFIRSTSYVMIILFILSGGGLWMLFSAMVLFGFGWYTTAPLSAGLVADIYGWRRMGTIVGVIRSCHMFGMAIGAYFGGAIFEFTGSYLIFFYFQCPLELMAAIFTLYIPKKGTYNRA